MNIVYIFIGGGLGSIARYVIGKGAMKAFVGNFPLGTFVSNVLACIILGLVVYTFSNQLKEHSWIQPFIVVGFCGGFSTFSSFSNETIQLFQTGNYAIALANILISLIVGLGIIYFLSLSASK
jgi:CrcB protein